MEAPILITQHLPGSFLPFLIQQLSEKIARTVVLATDGMRCEPNHVYIAPSTGHLQITNDANGKKIKILQEKLNRYMPSVDPMFESMGDNFGDKAIAIIFSGMGRDGLLGAEKVADMGGHVYAQDPASSVIWGMPGVVSRSGLASAILPPADMARHISRHYTVSVKKGCAS